MKRKVYVAGGMLALTLAIVVTAQLRAQAQNNPATNQPRAAPTPTGTKVAIVNLAVISKNYHKVKTFTEETKQAAQPFVDADKKLQTEHEKLVNESKQPGTTADRQEKIAVQIKDIQRRAEDNKIEAQKVVGKRNEAQLQILFKDIHDVITRLSQARGYELVLHYNDFTETSEYWSMQNIARKMQTTALVPVYWTGGVDITNDVVATLNSMVKQPAQTTTGTPTQGQPRQ